MSGSSTRVERRRPSEGPRVLGFAERVALFVGAMHKEHAAELFAGFSEPLEQRAAIFATTMKQWDSGRRQARLAHEFGVRPDAVERLKQVVVQAEGQLRAAVVAALPEALRKQYPQFSGGAESFPMVVRAVAARLVREAAR